MAAIREQEKRTSAEIRICITQKRIWRPYRYAWKTFDQLGMRNTQNRNGVLIMLMPRVRKVVIVGDVAIQAVVPSDYWQKVIDVMIQKIKNDVPLAALYEGLREIGDTLSIHWPVESKDVNELPDEIVK